MIKNLLILGFLLMVFCTAEAQNKDTIVVKPKTGFRFSRYRLPGDTTNLQTPKQAVFRSFALPGLGQYKNGKWWKVPLVPAGFVGLALVFQFNNRYYKQTLRELQFRFNNPKQSQDPEFPLQISQEQLVMAKDFYRRNRDLSIFGSALFYGIVAIDAYIDARLARFDVGQNLSFNIKPSIYVPSLVGNLGTPVPMIKLTVQL
jgi:hypothetical protein